jgi:hypothetical protein
MIALDTSDILWGIVSFILVWVLLDWVDESRRK